jgi:hypothetical protein
MISGKRDHYQTYSNIETIWENLQKIQVINNLLYRCLRQLSNSLK